MESQSDQRRKKTRYFSLSDWVSTVIENRALPHPKNTAVGTGDRKPRKSDRLFGFLKPQITASKNSRGFRRFLKTE